MGDRPNFRLAAGGHGVGSTSALPRGGPRRFAVRADVDEAVLDKVLCITNLLPKKFVQ